MFTFGRSNTMTFKGFKHEILNKPQFRIDVNNKALELVNWVIMNNGGFNKNDRLMSAVSGWVVMTTQSNNGFLPLDLMTPGDVDSYVRFAWEIHNTDPNNFNSRHVLDVVAEYMITHYEIYRKLPIRTKLFGKSLKSQSSITQSLRNIAKRLGVRLTVKRNGKRVYKSKSVLKKQIKNKLK